MTPETIIKITRGLLKGCQDQELKMINQYLLKRNVIWLTMKRIGDLTGSDRGTVQANIQKVYKNKSLVDLASDVELLIRM
jgi:hypothetical protein